MKKIIIMIFFFVFSLSSNFININKPILKSVKKKISHTSFPEIFISSYQVIHSSTFRKLMSNSVSSPQNILTKATIVLASKGGIVKELTNKYPLRMVRYYSTYGDNFIKILNQWITKLSQIQLPPSLKERYNFLFRNKKVVAEKFLDFLKYTGREGFKMVVDIWQRAKTGKLTSIQAKIAFAKLVTNPIGFVDSPNNSCSLTPQKLLHQDIFLSDNKYGLNSFYTFYIIKKGIFIFILLVSGWGVIKLLSFMRKRFFHILSKFSKSTKKENESNYIKERSRYE